MDLCFQSLQSQLSTLAETIPELKEENGNDLEEMSKDILEDEGEIEEDKIEGSEMKIERKSLRELVEEIYYDVKKISASIGKEGASRSESAIQGKTSERRNNVDGEEIEDESPEEFGVVDVRRKTLADEREWMRWRFNEERLKVMEPADGASLLGKTVDSISLAIVLTSAIATSCVIKFANHLSTTLTRPRKRMYAGKKIKGPISITGHTSEVFMFLGDAFNCAFLFSVEISNILRLTIFCNVNAEGGISFRCGFTPGNVPMNQTLNARLGRMLAVPDAWTSGANWSKVPIDSIISHDNLFVRVHMTVGPRSVVNVDILEDSNEMPKQPLKFQCPIISKTQSSSNEDLLSSVGLASNMDSLVCVVEILNCLNVCLKNPGRFVRKCELNNFMPPNVTPFKREVFVASDNEIVEAIFAYEIDTTDLSFVVAFRVEKTGCSFSAGFVLLPAVADKEAFDHCMDPTQWKIQSYRTYAMISQASLHEDMFTDILSLGQRGKARDSHPEHKSNSRNDGCVQIASQNTYFCNLVPNALTIALWNCLNQ